MPGSSGTSAVQATVPSALAVASVAPLSHTTAATATRSDEVPVTVTVPTAVLNVVPVGGDTMVMVGEAPSGAAGVKVTIRMSVAVLPEASTAVTVIRFVPRARATDRSHSLTPEPGVAVPSPPVPELTQV